MRDKAGVIIPGNYDPVETFNELVDTVEVRIVAILLGAGVPLLPSLENRIKLSLTAHKVYRTEIVFLEYAIT
jgi:dihydrofolate reductase